MTLKEQLVASVFIETVKNAIELARVERNPAAREKQLREAARRLNSIEAESIPADERQHLYTLYSEAYLIATEALVG